MKTKYEPTSSYTEHRVEGFAVLTSSAFQSHQDHLKEVLEEMKAQFQDIKTSLPEAAFKEVEGVRFWVELKLKKCDGAVFHPSADSLKRDGYNPEKAGDVEISNSKNFLKWSRDDQPSLLLHEVAHAYYFLAHAEFHPEVKAAYDEARASGIYKKVRHVNKGIREAYALRDQVEYFSELSEAYFGKNDYFPFTRDELEKHDPRGFKAVKQAWGV